jgi:NitT/TauT family transport system substrate-binding protein
MTRTIRLQSDSNAHDRPWRVAVEQGFFTAEGLDVEYHEDNPKGTAGRVEDFSQRWKESQLQKGALEVYPVCEWGAIERVQTLGGGKIIGLDTTVRTGALMVRKESKVQSLRELRNVPIAVTWMPAPSTRRSKRWKPPAFHSARSSSCMPTIASLRCIAE